MQLIIHIDGGSRGNPGPAAAGVSIVNAADRTAVHEAGYFLGEKTNNAAEYEALLRALELARTIGSNEIVIHCDSELIVKQVLDEYKVKSADLKPLHQQAQRKLLHFDRWQLKHVRREQNQRADQLVNMAMDAEQDVVVTDSGKGEVDAVPTASPPTAPAQTASYGNPGVTVNEQTSSSSRSGSQPDAPSGNDPTPGACRAFFTASILENENGTSCVFDRAAASARFGPGTPRDFCIYAARAALLATPIDDPSRLRNFRQIETTCPHCQAVVRITPQSSSVK